MYRLQHLSAIVAGVPYSQTFEAVNAQLISEVNTLKSLHDNLTVIHKPVLADHVRAYDRCKAVYEILYHNCKAHHAPTKRSCYAKCKHVNNSLVLN